jgi:uncharacterized protein
MMKDSPGKTALITGASVGIGRDLAQLFARDGHHLVLTARNAAQLQEVAQKIRDQYHVNVRVIPRDLSLAASPDELFDITRGESTMIDYLVNNAGFGKYGSFADSDLMDQLAMLELNIVSLTKLTRLFLPGMLARKSGRVMNVASTAAFVSGPFMAVYYASKAYVLSFSEAISDELAGTGVTVTAFCPGPTATEFQNRAGVAYSKLFQRNVMTSAAAARIGYDAMMQGRRRVVAGMKNKLTAFGTRLIPRKTASTIARKLHENHSTG